jgi:hypothetical protein
MLLFDNNGQIHAVMDRTVVAEGTSGIERSDTVRIAALELQLYFRGARFRHWMGITVVIPTAILNNMDNRHIVHQCHALTLLYRNLCLLKLGLIHMYGRRVGSGRAGICASLTTGYYQYSKKTQYCKEH